jgi:hypothetical protein
MKLRRGGCLKVPNSPHDQYKCWSERRNGPYITNGSVCHFSNARPMTGAPDLFCLAVLGPLKDTFRLIRNCLLKPELPYMGGAEGHTNNEVRSRFAKILAIRPG